MRAFLIAGSPEAEGPEGLTPQAGDLVIAVDSGLLHARAWGWPVDLLIGDLDSLAQAGATEAAASVAEVITAPPAKDETDLELALAAALGRGAHEVFICAALGGRTDHLLANVFLLARQDLAGLAVALVAGRESLRLLRAGETLHLAGAAGDLLSLIPAGGPATGITTEGLLYPLTGETLALGQARGVSNVFTQPAAAVTLRTGYLLVYHAAPAAASARPSDDSRGKS